MEIFVQGSCQEMDWSKITLHITYIYTYIKWGTGMFSKQPRKAWYLIRFYEVGRSVILHHLLLFILVHTHARTHTETRTHRNIHRYRHTHEYWISLVLKVKKNILLLFWYLVPSRHRQSMVFHRFLFIICNFLNNLSEK